MELTEIIKIEKLSEYMEFVEELPREYTLSRGQSKDYPLLPSALRKDDKNNRKYSKRVVRNFLDEFKINSYQYMEKPWDVNNDIEWMLYAQHYGIPTKLLDFTTSHIISLLFAVEKSFIDESQDDAVVYFLNPNELNLINKQQSQIINVSGDSQISSVGHDGPFVIQGRKINTRVNAQKGMFVLFQDEDQPLETINNEKVLKKIIIKGSEAKSILASLYSMGIGFSNIYPELASVAKDIVLQQDIKDYLREDE